MSGAVGGTRAWACSLGVGVLLALGASRAVEAQGWPDERSAGRFHCHADFPLDGLGPLLQDLGVLQQDLIAELGVPAADEDVHLYLFRSDRTYSSYLRRHFPRVPYRPALYIKHNGPGMVFVHQGAELSIDARHEGTHALLHAALPMVPLWLDEGLAEYFEAPRDQRRLGSEHLAEVRRVLRWTRPRPIEELEAERSLEQMKPHDYRDSWAWVHFMLHGPPEAKQELQSYLGDIARLQVPGDLSRRLRQRVPQLEQAFVAHFRRLP